MTNNMTPSLYALIIGTVSSIVLGVYLSNEFEAPYQYIIAILSEILVLIISVYCKLYEDTNKLMASLSDKDILLNAKRYIYGIKDKNFYLKFKHLENELIELANGKYSLNDLASVYADDITSIKSLERNDKLYSMCPVGERIEAQFSNKSFLASITEHINSSRRGVISQRIYIFKKESLFNTDICKNHLNLLVNNNIKVSVIFLDNESFKDALKLPRDFIIFNNNKVSIGIINGNNFVDGAIILSDKHSLEEYHIKYNQLLAQSEIYPNDINVENLKPASNR
jgi:hypothetical protein